ncbi:MAG TPA: M50 family metallopeptidase [Solirubrobacteraceae bacterium]|nr:M50 family metallopeptidase [Solirubrobacteraceae bacterium]
MSYVLAFLGFALLIILHEAGHFVAAKAVGMRVERFSLFFGRMLWSRRIGETEYGIAAIPLGGYVKITGMSSEEEFETPEIEARAYYNQPVWKRIAVIAAGPAVNVALAFVLVWVLFVAPSQPVASNRIASVLKSGAAASVLRPGDQLMSVDSVRGDAAALHTQIATHTCAGRTRVNGCVATTAATLVVRRDGALRTFRIKPHYSAAAKSMLVGFEFRVRYVSTSAVAAVGDSARALWRVTTRTVTDIVELFKPKARKQLHSIIGGYKYTQEAIASGWQNGIWIIALISLSLGIINLFPFLPLDGGHIFWALAEKVRGRRIPVAVMERAGLVGIALLAIVLFIGVSNDVSALAGKGLNLH